MGTSITVPVPSSEDGTYTRPPSTLSTIAAKLARDMPVVNQNGFTVRSKAETGTADVTADLVKPSPPPMVTAILEAAAAVGADPARLVDSETFMRAVGPISAADSVGLQEAVLDAMAANPSLAVATPPAPGMQRNPAQGRSATGWRPTATTSEDRIREQSQKLANQTPPGSVAP